MANNDVNRYLTFFLESRRDYVNSYNQVSEKFIKHHFILNAGAASVLAIFFVSKEGNLPYLKISALFFVLGILFSSIAILLDFFWGYWSLQNFDRNFFQPLDYDLETLQKKARLYSQFQKDNHSKASFTVKLRIFNGLVSYLWFFVGLFIIIFNNSNDEIKKLYVWVIPIFVLYSLLMLIIEQRCIEIKRNSRIN